MKRSNLNIFKAAMSEMKNLDDEFVKLKNNNEKFAKGISESMSQKKHQFTQLKNKKTGHFNSIRSK